MILKNEYCVNLQLMVVGQHGVNGVHAQQHVIVELVEYRLVTSHVQIHHPSMEAKTALKERPYRQGIAQH